MRTCKDSEHRQEGGVFCKHRRVTEKQEAVSDVGRKHRAEFSPSSEGTPPAP